MIRRPQSTIQQRRGAPRGFTLVELMVTIVIMAILSSMVLMALANTQSSARDARTRSTITRLDALIMAKWETYQTRRVPQKGTNDRVATSKYRLNAIRELQRLELPDLLEEVTAANKVLPASYIPSVNKAYRNLLGSATSEKSSAECLYAIIAHGINDRDAISQFNDYEIGDTDGDGCKEFLDGWGEPIFFLRWAPGYESPALLHKHEKESVKIGTSSIDVQMPHDVFDLLYEDPNAFMIYPLIYSGGEDKIRDIKNVNDPAPERTINNSYIDNNGISLGIGSLDNITNHEILAN